MNKADIDTALMALSRWRAPEYVLASPSQIKVMIEVFRPSLFRLYEAGWRSGYTVNGVPASA